MKALLRPLPLLLLLVIPPSISSAQEEAGNTPMRADEEAKEESVIELSPFEVTTQNDDRYYASNSISGSRLDVPIQDLPLTIEVLTAEFVKDTGATDLRESLRYSAGIVLQSQNDAYGTYDNAGGVNNPEGATGDRGQSSFKIRGFVTNNTLRNGFRRQHATDTVNIDRVEVVRGPSALLYGVGNFGGVVNYIPKRPLESRSSELTFGIGSDGWKRGALDTTGPLPWGFGYRLTAATEKADHWTKSRDSEQYFVSPVLKWNFWKTRILLDLEYGTAKDTGTGFQSVRTPTIVGLGIFDTDRLETFGFLEFDDKDPRTFRWSGPDTFLNTKSLNFNATVEQELLKNMYVLVGYNRSEVEFDQRDIFGGLATFASPSVAPPIVQPLLATIEAIQIIDGSNSDVRIPIGNAVLQYSWNGSNTRIDWDQVRAEFNYSYKAFPNSKWLKSEHSVLLGYSWERQQTENLGRVMDGVGFYYKNPTDSNPIRFDQPTDGQDAVALLDNFISGQTVENKGLYGVYSGRFLNDRLFIVAGVREDTTSNNDGFTQELTGRNPRRTELLESEVTKMTSQYGVSFQVLNGLSLYALRSEGVEPNFGGQRDGLGRSLESSVAQSEEVGVKVNLFDSRIAATFSVFKIKREGVPGFYWWAPAPVQGRFNRDANIVYRMNGVGSGGQVAWNPELQATLSPGDAGYNRYVAEASNLWQAAKATLDSNGRPVAFQQANQVDLNGDGVFQSTEGDGQTYWYLNASHPAGAAFLDAVFANLQDEFDRPRDERLDGDPWPGWLYIGQQFADNDYVTNFAAKDISSVGDLPNRFTPIEDQSEGFEAQVIWTPNDNFQLLLNYSNVKRQITAPGSLVEYPFADGNWDRWANWYFPNANWGLAGVAPNIAYPGGTTIPDPRGGGGTINLPNQDTSVWSGVGWGLGESLDDTPEHVVSWWARYDLHPQLFEPLAGLQMGFGGQWESGREYASAFTTAGQLKQNETGTSIKAFTEPRLTINLMLKYGFDIGREKRGARVDVQLNVDNALDDTDQYGLVYAPGRSWRLITNINF